MMKMVFIGMDHGTTGISFAILDSDGEVLEVFKISREDSKAGRVSAIEEISKRVNLDDIELMVVTYAMGDGFNKIVPMDKVENIKDLVSQRNIARNEKNWAESDRIRNILIEKGYNVKDTNEGTIISK